MTHDFAVEPWNRREFARPVRFLVRPGEPRGLVRLPLGGHAEAGRLYFSSHRLRMGAYASMRRSRKNGQFWRTSSKRRGSHSTISVSSLSVEACAMTWPKGSE